MFKKIKNWFDKIKATKAAKTYTPDIDKLSPKDAATAMRQPWVAVLDTTLTKKMYAMDFLNLTGTTTLSYN